MVRHSTCLSSSFPTIQVPWLSDFCDNVFSARAFRLLLIDVGRAPAAHFAQHRVSRCHIYVVCLLLLIVNRLWITGWAYGSRGQDRC